MTTEVAKQNKEEQAPFVHQAKQALRLFFQWRNIPFHLRQLQVLFETQFFHITTTQAVYQLVDEGTLLKIPYKSDTTHLEFIAPSRTVVSSQAKEVLLSHIRVKANIVTKYSAQQVRKDLADHLEALVKHELRANGLKNISKHANSYRGKIWTKNNRNLDFIADHPTGAAFGVQVKNELESIEKEELLAQLEICEYLKLRPIFVVRYMPWSFTPIVGGKGGYVITIGNQIYPLGYRALVEDIRSKLSLPGGRISKKLKAITPKLRTEWPVEVRTELPDDACERLAAWFRSVFAKQTTSVDSQYRLN